MESHVQKVPLHVIHSFCSYLWLSPGLRIPLWPAVPLIAVNTLVILVKLLFG